MTRTQKTKVKNEVREYVLSEIENHTQGSESPVDGSTFAALSSSYARFKRSKGSGDDADLHLTDAMTDDLNESSRNKENGVEFRITQRIQKLKAFNHNTGDTVPRRSFLPDDTKKRGKNSGFNKEIRKGIRDIIRKARSGNEET